MSADKLVDFFCRGRRWNQRRRADSAPGDEREENIDLIEPAGIVAQLRGHRNASTRFARRDAAVTFEQHILQKITAGDFLA